MNEKVKQEDMSKNELAVVEFVNRIEKLFQITNDFQHDWNRGFEQDDELKKAFNESLKLVNDAATNFVYAVESAEKVVDQYLRRDTGFTRCNQCHEDTLTIMNIGRVHWGYCQDCMVKEALGENLFSGWREQTQESWDANEKFLAGFKDLTVQDGEGWAP